MLQHVHGTEGQSFTAELGVGGGGGSKKLKDQRVEIPEKTLCRVIYLRNWWFAI